MACRDPQFLDQSGRRLHWRSDDRLIIGWVDVPEGNMAHMSRTNRSPELKV